MSNPNSKAELHELVSDYVNQAIGEPQEAHYLHEEINTPDKRTLRFEMFLEWIKN